MKRFWIAAWLLSACAFEHNTPVPPPPPPPPPSHVRTAPVTTTVTPPPMTTMPQATGMPTTMPTASTVPPMTTMPPGGVPPTTMVMPHVSAMCQRAERCCALIARYAPMPGAAHRCQRLALARDTDCSRAIGAMADAILQQGERPPDVCTQPGRGR